MLLTTFAAAYGGFLCLALSQQRHWRAQLSARVLTRAVQRTLRGLGASLLVLSLLLALLSDGVGFGILLWATALSLNGLLVMLTLASRQPRQQQARRAR